MSALQAEQRRLDGPVHLARPRRAVEATELMAYRIRALPGQLYNARRKLAALEDEARRYGMTDLLQDACDAS